LRRGSSSPRLKPGVSLPWNKEGFFDENTWHLRCASKLALLQSSPRLRGDAGLWAAGELRAAARLHVCSMLLLSRDLAASAARFGPAVGVAGRDTRRAGRGEAEMIDLTPEEEARLRRWLAMEEPDIDAALERAAETLFSAEKIEQVADAIGASIASDIEMLLRELEGRLTALERLVMRSMPVVRRQQ